MKTLIAILMACTFTLVGCEDGPAEDLGERIDDATTDVGNAVEDACEDVKDAAGASNSNC